MDRIKAILTIAAVAGMLSASQAFAQDDCGCSASIGDSYTTSAGRSSFFNMHRRLSISKAEFRAFRSHADIVRQRNEAWPKPFQCHDRQAYFATFYPMYQRGYEIQSTLTDAHFKRDSNELNSAGKQKIAGIMQNLPVERRQIFVFQKGDAEQTHARVAAVKVAVSEWFGHLSQPTIATTTNPAYYQSGLEVQQLNTNFLGALPTPGVAIGGGGGGDAGGN